MRNWILNCRYGLVLIATGLFVISGLDQIRITSVVMNMYAVSEIKYKSDSENRNTTTGTSNDKMVRSMDDTSITATTATLTTITSGPSNTGGSKKIDSLSDQRAPTPTMSSTASTLTPLQHRYDKKNDTITYYNPERPTNLRLVFMGDSTSRFQYISFVNFLQTGRWIDDATKLVLDGNDIPLHCNNVGVKSRERFYTLTHAFLQPNELKCDCRGYSENRYYIDTERNNYISYINKFGERSTTGQYLPYQMHANSTNETMFTKSSNKWNEWKYQHWNETIEYHIAQLKPKPQFLLFNAGLHNHDLHLASVRQSILDVTKRHDIIPIYRTTTYPNNQSIGLHEFPQADHDSLLCGTQNNEKHSTNFQYCMDVSWTSLLNGNDDYYDYYHVKPYWNYYMNLQTLLYIQKIQQVEQRRNDNSHDSGINTYDNNIDVSDIFRSEDVERMIRSNDKLTRS